MSCVSPDVSSAKHARMIVSKLHVAEFEYETHLPAPAGGGPCHRGAEQVVSLRQNVPDTMTFVLDCLCFSHLPGSGEQVLAVAL